MIENLPRFVMLHGPRHECYDFSAELLRRDMTNSVIQDDLAHCLVEGMIQTMFDGAWLDVDTEQYQTWDRALPVGVPTSISSYIDQQRDLHRSILGEDILGQIYLKDYLANGYDELSPTIILRDYDHAPDAKPFLTKYGQRGLCCIHLRTPFPRSMDLIRRQYYMPPLDPKKQVDQFLLDLKQEERHTA